MGSGSRRLVGVYLLTTLRVGIEYAMNVRQTLIGPNLYRWAILDEEIMLWFVYTTDHRAFNRMFWRIIEKHGMF